MAVGRTNSNAGGGAGATWTITGVVGATVTVTGNGKTYTKTIPASGKVEFKGLTAGTWTAKMSKSGETPVTITRKIDTNYSDTISFFSATIAVTYPAGSTCTCTNGSTTLTASGTSGSYTFTVPRAGTWTVKAVQGSKSTSKNVTITSNGQSVSVTLEYLLYLYNEGDECTDVTGGWRVNTTIAESAAKESNRIWTGNLLSSGNKSWIYMLNPSSRIAQFNTLKIQVDRQQITNTPNFGLMLGSTPPENLNGYTYKTLYITYKDVGSGNGELSLDISNATADSMRVMLWSFYSTYIYKIWLE